MALKDFTMYRELKNLKLLIREHVIRVMPKAHKYPDALYLKEHIGSIVRLMAAASVTREPAEKVDYANGILYELYIIQDEIEEQEESMVISLNVAARIYAEIAKIEQQLLRYRKYFDTKPESDGSRSTECAQS